MSYTVKIKGIQNITHDVKQLTVEKPDGYRFLPGQATEVAIGKDGWRDEKRPFTFTSLPKEDHLEFIIKIYPDHNGVTEQIGELKTGDNLIIGDAWGTIQYNSEGVFLAGGAGVTPFISILRHLRENGEIGNNRLIFSNKTSKDVILKEEFESMLGNKFTSVVTDEFSKDDLFLDGFIDKDFLKKQITNFSRPFYVCGPAEFNEAIITYLEDLGADPDALVFDD